MTRQQLLQNARALPARERIDLAMDLWEMIDGGDLAVIDAQRQELDRRIAEDAADPEPGEDWESLKAKLLSEEF